MRVKNIIFSLVMLALLLVVSPIQAKATDYSGYDFNIGEPNDSKDSAIKINLNKDYIGEIDNNTVLQYTEVNYSEKLNQKCDEDWFTFDLVKGKRYTIKINTREEPLIAVYSPNGMVENAFMCNCNNTLVAQETGTYYLKMYCPLYQPSKKQDNFYILNISEDSDTHIWDDGVLTTEPTDIISGEKTYTCKDCGETKTETINANITYQTHVQNVGWQGLVSDGAMSGTSGKSLRLEGIKIDIKNITGTSGGILYRTHVQNIGWTNWSQNGEMSSTSGKSLRLEAIQIKLSGDVANYYDVYYRVHAQNYGWLGWAKNGESAGTSGYSYRLEAIQIVLVPKGGTAPGSTVNVFKQK